MNAVVKSIIPFSVLLFSCSGNSESGKENDSTITKFDSLKVVDWNFLKSDSAVNEMTLQITAHVGDIGEYVEETNGKITVPFFERRNQKAGFRLLVSIKTGEGPNLMSPLPAEFTPLDFRMIDKNHLIIRKSDRVILTFKMTSKCKDESSHLKCVYADLIELERAEPYEISNDFENAIALTDSLINDSLTDNLWCYLAGEIELPELILPYTNAITLNFKSRDSISIHSIDIPITGGPSTMNDLPDGFTDDDLYIRDYYSKKVSNLKRVKLYGVWERYAHSSSFPGNFYLEEIEVQP